MNDTPKVLAAKADAEQAQARFMATLHELQHRVAPQVAQRGGGGDGGHQRNTRCGSAMAIHGT